MSLTFGMETYPENLTAKTHGVTVDNMPPGTLFLGDYEIAMEDFIMLAYYVMTNTDLEPNDPRLQFLNSMNEMKIVPGYNPGATRLKTDIHPLEGE